MNRVRILGIGSPSGDDQAGWLTVDALADCGVRGNHGLAIDKLDRPGASLIGLLDNTDWVILVDAMQSGDRPGRVKRFDQDAWPDYTHGLSSHGLGVLDALSLARALGKLPPRVDLYGIEIGLAYPGERASAEIRDAARHLAGHIAADLAAFVSGGIAPILNAI
jgi:hydrogenase maturation protease